MNEKTAAQDKIYGLHSGFLFFYISDKSSANEYGIISLETVLWYAVS